MFTTPVENTFNGDSYKTFRRFRHGVVFYLRRKPSCFRSNEHLYHWSCKYSGWSCDSARRWTGQEEGWWRRVFFSFYNLLMRLSGNDLLSVAEHDPAHNDESNGHQGDTNHSSRGLGTKILFVGDRLFFFFRWFVFALVGLFRIVDGFGARKFFELPAINFQVKTFKYAPNNINKSLPQGLSYPVCSKWIPGPKAITLTTGLLQRCGLNFAFKIR